MKYFKSEKVTWCTSYIPISCNLHLFFLTKNGLNWGVEYLLPPIFLHGLYNWCSTLQRCEAYEEVYQVPTWAFKRWVFKDASHQIKLSSTFWTFVIGGEKVSCQLLLVPGESLQERWLLPSASVAHGFQGCAHCSSSWTKAWCGFGVRFDTFWICLTVVPFYHGSFHDPSMVWQNHWMILVPPWWHSRS